MLWAVSSLLRCYLGRGKRDLSFTKNISTHISEELPCASIFTAKLTEERSVQDSFPTLWSLQLSPFPRIKTFEGLVPPHSYCSELGVSEMGVRGGLTCLGPQHSTGRSQSPCMMCRSREEMSTGGSRVYPKVK